MNVDSSNGYPLSSDDDVDPNDSVDDNGSFFDELVDDDDGSYIEEEAEYDEEGSAEPNNNDVLDDENEEGSYIDEEGSYIDEEGSYIDEEGSFVDEEDSFVDEEESIVDEEDYGIDSFYGDEHEQEQDDDDDDRSYVEEEVIEDGDIEDDFVRATPPMSHHDTDRAASHPNNYHSPVRQPQSLPFRSVTPSEEPARSSRSDDDDDDEMYGSNSEEDDDEAQQYAPTDKDDVANHEHAEEGDEYDLSNSQSESGDVSDSDERQTIITTTTDIQQQQQVQKQLQYLELENSKDELCYRDDPSVTQNHLGMESHHSHDNDGVDDANMNHDLDVDKMYDDYDDGHQSYESGMSDQKSYESGMSQQYDDEVNSVDQYSNNDEDSDGQQSYGSGSSNQCEEEVNDTAANYVDDDYANDPRHRSDLPQQDGGEDEYGYNDNDAKSYDSGHSQQYDDEEEGNDYDEPPPYEDDDRSNDFDGDEQSQDEGMVNEGHPQYQYDDAEDPEENDDRPEDDEQASYASSGMSNGDEQQSYDDNDDQQSYASGQSEEVDLEHGYNQSDDDFDDNEDLSDDGQDSYLSQNSNNNDHLQPEYDDDDVDQDFVQRNNNSQIPYNSEEPEQYGSSEDENDSYHSNSGEVNPFDDDLRPNVHDRFETMQDQVDVSEQFHDKDYPDFAQTYEPSGASHRIQNNEFSDNDDEEEEEGSYMSEDNSQQFADEDYEENDGQQYVDEDDDDATFMSEMIGPPPFVEDDTITEDYAETDNDDEVVEENGRQHLVANDEDDYADDDVRFGTSSESNQDDDNKLDHDEWSDRSASTESHSQDRSTSHSSPDNEISMNINDATPDVSSDYPIDPPSYHTLQSEKPMEKGSSHSSIARVSVSKSSTLLNVGVDTDFSGFTSKTPSIVTKDSIAGRAASTHSRKSCDDKTRSSAENSSKTDSNQKYDELFIVNTSNRGAQSKIFYSQQRQSSGDFSVDTMQFDIDTDVDNSRSNTDPADEAPNGRGVAQPKNIGVARNNSTDSESFFRSTNKYISADSSDVVRNESVRSNRTYLSGSNHASAKFENADQKRYSFVGSDEDSGSLDTDDDGFEHDVSEHTPASGGMPSVSTDAKSTDTKSVQNQYNILREVALEIVSSDRIKVGTDDIESLKSTSSKSSAPVETAEFTETIPRKFIDAPLENEYTSSRVTPEYQVYNYSVDESAGRIENEADLHFSRKDSVDSYPLILSDNKLTVEEASPYLSTFRTMENNIDNEMQEGGENDFSNSSSSSSSLSSEEETYPTWNGKLHDTEQNIVTKYQAPTSDLENTHRIANLRSQHSTATTSSVDDEPHLNHPWIPISEKKPATPLLTKTLPSSDDSDMRDTNDIEAGLYQREEQSPPHEQPAMNKIQTKKTRKKRPKWMYGTVGIVFLFIFMLMIVLLTRSKKDASSPDLPPISSPNVVPTTAPVQGQIPSTPTSLLPAAPSSSSNMFVLQATLLGSSGDAYGFGSSVAINDDLIVVGEPGTESVATYYIQAEEWIQGETVTEDKINSLFGKALDLANRTMVVGAPFVSTDTNASVGVYVYTHDPMQQTWQQIGTTLLGDDDTASNGEENFGYAVAVSYELQVIVGAPKNSRDSENAGRVYTFKYQQSSTSWVSNELFALVGDDADDMFGSSVAISRDGTRFIAGAPGTSGPGYVRIYYWIDTRWQLLSVLRGENENENCGTSVVILSDVGDYIAIGCPGFDNGAGRVVVYQQQLSTGRYEQIGPNLVGNPGDGIGYSSGITGDVVANGPIIILSTTNGSVVRYDYDSTSDVWRKLYPPISISATDHASLAFTSGDLSDTLVIGLSGNSNYTLIYTADPIIAQSISPELTTLEPTASPQPLPTTSSVPSLSYIFSPINIPVTTLAPTIQAQIETTFAPFLDLSTTDAPAVGTPAPTSPMQVTAPAPVASSPVNTEYLWTVAGGPFEISSDDTSASSSNSTRITSIALGDTRMVMGSSALGIVQSFFQQTITILAVWETKSYQNLFSSGADGTNDEYGAAMDMMDDFLIVGAPGGIGAVYCYSVDTTTGDWVSYGSKIQQEQSTTSEQERFGSSVAICTGSTVPRMAVGAPNANSEDNTLTQLGRVSIYEYDTTIMDWSRNANDIVGTVSNERFGTAIDICSSGNFIVIGGPGGGDSNSGAATIYQYSTLDWYAVTTVSGEATNEEFGSSVHMLSEDGFVVAIGGPNYDTNRGRIVVYERNALTGKYDLAGVPIIGEINEHIGLPNALSGSSNLSKTIFKIIVQAANGYVKLYEYSKSSSTGTWTTTIIAVTDSSSSSLSSDLTNTIVTAATSDASSIVVTTNGDNGVATIFNEY